LDKLESRSRIKTWQETVNALHYTKDVLICDNCKKNVSVVIELYGEGIFCWGCLKRAMRKYFEKNNDDFIYAREIEDVLFGKRKKYRKIERSKMSLKLRWDVMKGDGFQCVKCGASGKDANLEVDHIKPISKGGETVLSNLQTLCFKCNRGKSNG